MYIGSMYISNVGQTSFHFNFFERIVLKHLEQMVEVYRRYVDAHYPSRVGGSPGGV